MTTPKLRLYLDTSAISLIDTDSERGEITREFFRIVSVQTDEYELVISPVTKREIEEAPETKQWELISFLRAIPHVELSRNDEAEKLASLYVDEGVLTEKHLDDLTHVAYAVISRCEYIISWNMKHLVRERTITRASKVNMLYNFPRVFIATPLIITGDIHYEND